jgi:WD40 repeat protein
VARPASALYQLRKFARRHRTLVLATALVFAAMAVATVVSIRQAGIAMRARSFAVEEQGRANLSAQVARREARRALLSAAAAAIEGGDPISARQSLEGVEQGERGWAWQYWNARLDNSIALIRLPSRVAAVRLMPGGDEIRALTVDGRILDGGIWDPNLRPGPLLANAPVGAAVFVADGERVIAACGPGYKSLDEFDACDGSLVRHIADLPARGVIIKASDDGKVVAVALKTQTGAPIADDVWVWDHDAPGHKTRPSGRTTGMAMTPDGRSLLFGFEGGLLWESGAAGLRDHAGWSRAALRYAITRDGSRLAMGGEDKTVFIWGVGMGRRVFSLRGHAGDITAMAFDPAGVVLASAATDRTIRVWEAATGKPLATLMGHTAAVRELRYSDDGSRLVSISDDGSIRVWTLQPYESTSILRAHTSYVYGVTFSPDGGRIVSGGWDGRAHIWGAAGGEHLRALDSAGQGYITAVAVAHDGRTIFTGHKTDEWDQAQICLWDTETGSPLDRFSFGRAELHGLGLNRAGTRLYTGWERGAVGVLDLTSHPLVMDTLIPRHATFALALSPDERRVALGGSTGWVRIADVGTGEYISGWVGHTRPVTAVAWCPTRPLLASASADSTIRFWNSETGELVAKLDRHWGKVYALAFSPTATASLRDRTTPRSGSGIRRAAGISCSSAGMMSTSIRWFFRRMEGCW